MMDASLPSTPSIDDENPLLVVKNLTKRMGELEGSVAKLRMENPQLRSYLGLRDYTPLVSTEAARQNENCGTSARAGRAKSKLDK